MLLDKRVPTFPKHFPWPGPSLVHYSIQVGRCPCIMKLTPTTEKEPPQNGIYIRGRGGILGFVPNSHRSRASLVDPSAT